MATDSAVATEFVGLVERTIDVDGSRWGVIFADILAPALLDHDGAIATPAQAVIARYVRLVQLGKVSRTRLVIADVHLLAIVQPDTRTCRLYTPGATEEAFLLQLREDEHLQGHVRAIGQSPPTFTAIDEVTAAYRLADLASPDAPIAGHDRASLMREVERQVHTLIGRVNAYTPALVERMQNWFLSAIAEDEPLLRQVLRFVAVLPSLRFDRSGHEVVRALREAVGFLPGAPMISRHRRSLRGWLLSLAARAIALTARLLPSRVVGAVVDWAVGLMAARFIIPDTPAAVEARLVELHRLGRDASLDQLGELVLVRQEAERYAEAVIRLIDLVAAHYGSSADRRVVNDAGIPRAQVSVKLSALSTHFNPVAPQATAADMHPRLSRILRQAKRRGAFICFDAEHYAYRDLSLHIPAAVLAAAADLDDFRDFGFVVQAYLKDAVPFLAQVTELARRRGHRIQVRLVKGAYWDAETAEAAAHDVPAPTFWNKAETDIHFQQLVLFILERSDFLGLALASHNVREHAFAETVRAYLYPHAPAIEHQVLHRMVEGVGRSLAAAGWVVRDYVPVGDLVPGIAYLVRRILENASQVGILAQSRTELSADVVATDPARSLAALIAQSDYAWDPAVRGEDRSFRPSPPVRLHLPVEQQAFADVLASTVVETRRLVAPDAVPEAVQQAVRGARAWAAWPPEARAAVLIGAAEQIRAQRLALGALIVREGRKVWAEALADVDEAVDYLRFYARSSIHWHAVLGARLQPVGVAAVIAPWNFPLAIPCGMTAAALAAGNAVLLKPAEQTPAIGAALATLLHAAGVPPEALVFVPGDGRVGAALVANPQVDLVAFTGSWEVGAHIFYSSLRAPTRRLRQVIAETGSKNPIIVAATADLDAALDGILRSAFGHAGQKCSACSRVLVDARLALQLAERLGKAAEDLRVGGAEDAATQLNPVITTADAARLRAAAIRAAAEVQAAGGRVIVDATARKAASDNVGPAVFLLPQGVDPANVSLAKEELFGPVVHVIPYGAPEEALRFANGVPYALTAGIFAQSAAEVDFFAKRLDAGNLYINRPITAARVGIEPFGGFKRSGTGPKAGGDDYLLAFVQIAPCQPLSAAELVESILRARGQALAPHPTVDIPGQLNRLVYDRPLGHGLVLADAPIEFRHAVVAAALVAGNHLTIVAPGADESQALRETAARANLHLSVADRFRIVAGTDAEALASVSAFDFVAGSPAALRRAAHAYAECPHPEQLPAFIGPPYGAPPDLPLEFVRRFVRSRLIAENTIRHGALISTGGMWT
ncbi:MAG TPA: proline dehydrogenase family protein [Candidatus Tectomicrobia bacterium]|nr:proline dehydrogenase family protein [Candidatus Tectomicrobia bacterium]